MTSYNPPEYRPDQPPETPPVSYEQDYPVSQGGWQLNQPRPPQKRGILNNNAIFFPIVVAIAVGIIGLSGWIVLYKTTWIPDSGIRACEAMAKQVQDANKKEPSGDSDKVTQKEYDQLREAFSDSRYKDIREPGVQLVDTIWTLQNTPEDQQAGMALASMGSMMSNLQSLQTGCKNHGIQVDLMQQQNN